VPLVGEPRRLGHLGGAVAGQQQAAGQLDAAAGQVPVWRDAVRQPVLVFVGSKEVLSAAHARAARRGLPISVFTSDLFHTGNDRDNRAAVRAVRAEALDLVGLAVHGPRGAVDKILKGARMHE
jgi:hypothetical protein